jgi:hypothetical protein
MSNQKSLGQISYEAKLFLISVRRGNYMLYVPWTDADEDVRELEAIGANAVREETIRQCAEIACNACLVPPDGGSPTEEERLICEAASRNILALLPSNQKGFKPCS